MGVLSEERIRAWTNQRTRAQVKAGRAPGPCTLWRYRAAGDRFLQIEAWPVAVRMLEGASVHQSMIEIRPATLDTHTG